MCALSFVFCIFFVVPFFLAAAGARRAIYFPFSCAWPWPRRVSGKTKNAGKDKIQPVQYNMEERSACSDGARRSGLENTSHLRKAEG